MATATVTKKKPRKTKTAVKKPVVKRTRPLLTEDELKQEEKYYLAKGYKVVPGSICNRGEDPEQNPKFASKRSVVVTCSKRGCHNTYRLATSDLHQKPHCDECTMEARRQRKNESRRKTDKKIRRRSPK